MRLLIIPFLISFSIIATAQFTEELVEIDYEQNQLTSIQVYPDIPYIDQMRGGIVVNTDNDWYTFTSHGGDFKLVTVDIATGDILYEVDVPQIQMLQFQPGSDELVGISKGNPSGIVSVGYVNYKTGAWRTAPAIGVLENASISTHNSVIDQQNNLLYFISSLSGTNNRSIVVVDVSDGSFVKSFEIMPANESIAGLAYDADRNLLLGLLGLSPNGKSLVEVDPVNETITEIKKITEISNTFGGHRYWAYNDAGDEFFVIGLDDTQESYFYVLDSNDGTILYQHLYEDDAWIMEEHSPLEIRYSPNTQQLLGLRKGEPLPPPVSTTSLKFLKGQLKITPNPATAESITISTLTETPIQNISIFSIDGKLLSEQINLNKNSVEISLESLSSGLYFLLAFTSDGAYRQSFVVE